MKLKVLAILAASLTISTGASADSLFLDFDSTPFTFGVPFTTDYGQVFAQDQASLYPPGKVAIGSNPNDYHNQFVNLPNNQSGNMLLVNGSVEPNKAVLTYTNNSILGAGS